MARSVLVVSLLLTVFMMGCSGGSSGAASSVAIGGSNSGSSGSSGGSGSGGSSGGSGSGGSSGGGSTYTMVPLTWESIDSGSQSWSTYLFNLILTQATALMGGSSDVTQFCSNYASITDNQKANFWAYLLSEVAYYESGDNPTNRYVETSLGTDPVTGSQVVSEGLLQLSYQDQLNYSFCQFDWAADSKLSPTDPNKTILNPLTNLHCGALILNQQVKNHGAIAISSGAYWSTLMIGSAYNKLAAIEAATQKLSFCK